MPTIDSIIMSSGNPTYSVPEFVKMLRSAQQKSSRGVVAERREGRGRQRDQIEIEIVIIYKESSKAEP